MRSRAFTLPASRMPLISRSTDATAVCSSASPPSGQAEQVALAQDRHFDLLHGCTLRGLSPGLPGWRRRRRGPPSDAGQAVDQGVDARARRGQPRTQVVALVGDGAQLLLQQGVRSLLLFVAQQESFDAFGKIRQS